MIRLFREDDFPISQEELSSFADSYFDVATESFGAGDIKDAKMNYALAEVFYLSCGNRLSAYICRECRISIGSTPMEAYFERNSGVEAVKALFDYTINRKLFE
jgi:hypothetical protein